MSSRCAWRTGTFTHPHIDQSILNVRMKEEVRWNLLDDVLSDVRHGQVRCSIENAEIDNHRRVSEQIRFSVSEKTLQINASEYLDSLHWLIIFRVTCRASRPIRSSTATHTMLTCHHGAIHVHNFVRCCIEERSGSGHVSALHQGIQKRGH